MGKYQRIPCMIMRGGTSKGVYIMAEHLPQDQAERDQILLQIMGSPDKKQISGLGGGTSVTSKVAIIAKSDREDADVEYTFAQVSVDKAIVSYKGNCGNISSGVGPFALEQTLLPMTGDMTSVRIYNTNTNKIIVADVVTKSGMVNYDGDYAIAGVPGTAAPVKLNFLNPTGSVSGKLLPTGNVVDVLDVPTVGAIQVSIVDAANPLAFIRAEDLGLTGVETPEEIDSNPELLETLERIRGVAAVKMGLIDDYKTSAIVSPTIPKLTIVSKPQGYTTTSGSIIESTDIDVCAEMMSMQKVHPSYAMTGAMCTVAAWVVEGSLVHQVGQKKGGNLLRIGHPAGILEAAVDYEQGDIPTIHSTAGFRTAQLIMGGEAVIHTNT